MEQLGAKQPQRQSQVQEQVSRLEGNLAALHDSIEKLQNRLSSVLKSSVLGETEKDEDSVELVVLAITVAGFADSVKLATYEIEDIFGRIEL